MMAHRPKLASKGHEIPIANDDGSVAHASSKSKVVVSALSNHDELSELTACVGEECGIHDDTELLVVNMIICTMFIKSNRTTTDNLWRRAKEALLRVLMTYVSHALLQSMMHCAHAAVAHYNMLPSTS